MPSDPEWEKIMHKLQLLSSMSRRQTVGKGAEREKVDFVTGFVVPTVVSLDVLLVMIAVNVEPDAFVEMTQKRGSV